MRTTSCRWTTGLAACLVLLLAGAAVLGHLLWNSPILEFFPAHPWEGGEWFLIPLATAVKGLPLLGSAFGCGAAIIAHDRIRELVFTPLKIQF